MEAPVSRGRGAQLYVGGRLHRALAQKGPPHDMSHEGANVTALVDSCNVVYHSQNVKELRGLNVDLEVERCARRSAPKIGVHEREARLEVPRSLKIMIRGEFVRPRRTVAPPQPTLRSAVLGGSSLQSSSTPTARTCAAATVGGCWGRRSGATVCSRGR